MIMFQTHPEFHPKNLLPLAVLGYSRPIADEVDPTTGTSLLRRCCKLAACIYINLKRYSCVQRLFSFTLWLWWVLRKDESSFTISTINHKKSKAWNLHLNTWSEIYYSSLNTMSKRSM